MNLRLRTFRVRQAPESLEWRRLLEADKLVQAAEARSRELEEDLFNAQQKIIALERSLEQVDARVHRQAVAARERVDQAEMAFTRILRVVTNVLESKIQPKGRLTAIKNIRSIVSKYNEEKTMF